MHRGCGGRPILRDGIAVPLDPRANRRAPLSVVHQSFRGYSRQAAATTTSTRSVYKVRRMRRLEDRTVPTVQPTGASLYFSFFFPLFPVVASRQERSADDSAYTSRVITAGVRESRRRVRPKANRGRSSPSLTFVERRTEERHGGRRSSGKRSESGLSSD